MQDNEKLLWEQLNNLVEACKCFKKASAWESVFQKTPLDCETFDQTIKESELLLRQIPLPEK